MADCAGMLKICKNDTLDEEATRRGDFVTAAARLSLSWKVRFAGY